MGDLGGALERAVMDALWAADEPLRVREMLNLLNATSARRLAYNTVQTVAERLTRKGLLRRVPDGQAFRYAPTQSRDDFTVALMLDALTDSPDQGAILARLVESVPEADARRMLDALNARATGPEAGPESGSGVGSDEARG